jgi:tyrosyl-tRNA synthetase
MPLLEGLDGVQKMSKSLGNYVGITDEPQDMFGKLMSLSDDLMFRYYELLSSLDLEEIERLRKGVEDGRLHPKDVKTDLALELVARFHSEEAALSARAGFEAQFTRGEVPEDIPETRLDGSWETVYLPKLLKEAGLAKSASEARRLIQQGAVTLDGEKVGQEDVPVPGADSILKVGKRRYLRLLAP